MFALILLFYLLEIIAPSFSAERVKANQVDDITVLDVELGSWLRFAQLLPVEETSGKHRICYNWKILQKFLELGWSFHFDGHDGAFLRKTFLERQFSRWSHLEQKPGKLQYTKCPFELCSGGGVASHIFEPGLGGEE
jgi:hypothetical protein